MHHQESHVLGGRHTLGRGVSRLPVNVTGNGRSTDHPRYTRSGAAFVRPGSRDSSGHACGSASDDHASSINAPLKREGVRDQRDQVESGAQHTADGLGIHKLAVRHDRDVVGVGQEPCKLCIGPYFAAWNRPDTLAPRSRR